MRDVRTALGVAAVVALAAIGGGSAPLGAQAEPELAAAVLTVAPQRLDPGQTLAITVANCFERPDVGALELDAVYPVPLTAGPGAGEWHGSAEARGFDLFVHGTCGDQDLGEVRVDVDNPLIGFQPIGSMLAPADPPSTVYGSDCPDGTVASIRFDEVDLGREPAIGTPVTAPIDSRGDWQVDTPAYALYAVVPPPGTPPGTVLRELTVNASCGDVTYEVLRIPIQVVPGDPLVDPPFDAPPSEPPTSPPAAPPATPLPGGSHFTG